MKERFIFFLVFQASSIAQDARTPPEQQPSLTTRKHLHLRPLLRPLRTSYLPRTIQETPPNHKLRQIRPIQRVDFSTEKYPFTTTITAPRPSRRLLPPSQGHGSLHPLESVPKTQEKRRIPVLGSDFRRKRDQHFITRSTVPIKWSPLHCRRSLQPSVVTVDYGSDDVIMLPAVESPVTCTPGNSPFLRTQRNGTPNGDQSINQPKHSMVNLTASFPTKPDLTKAARVSPRRDQTLPREVEESIQPVGESRFAGNRPENGAAVESRQAHGTLPNRPAEECQVYRFAYAFRFYAGEVGARSDKNVCGNAGKVSGAVSGVLWGRGAGLL